MGRGFLRTLELGIPEYSLTRELTEILKSLRLSNKSCLVEPCSIGQSSVVEIIQGHFELEEISCHKKKSCTFSVIEGLYG